MLLDIEFINPSLASWPLLIPISLLAKIHALVNAAGYQKLEGFGVRTSKQHSGQITIQLYMAVYSRNPSCSLLLATPRANLNAIFCKCTKRAWDLYSMHDVKAGIASVTVRNILIG